MIHNHNKAAPKSSQSYRSQSKSPSSKVSNSQKCSYVSTSNYQSSPLSQSYSLLMNLKQQQNIPIKIVNDFYKLSPQSHRVSKPMDILLDKQVNLTQQSINQSTIIAIQSKTQKDHRLVITNSSPQQIQEPILNSTKSKIEEERKNKIEQKQPPPILIQNIKKKIIDSKISHFPLPSQFMSTSVIIESEQNKRQFCINSSQIISINNQEGYLDSPDANQEGELEKQEKNEEVELGKMIKSSSDKLLNLQLMGRNVDLLVLLQKKKSQSKQIISLTSSFFEILNDDLCLMIAKFLPIDDIITLASVSRQARKLVPIVITKINYNNQIQSSEMYFFEKLNQYYRMNAFYEIKQRYLNLLQRFQVELEQSISDFSLRKFPNKEAILQILAAGIMSSKNKRMKPFNVINYINRKGIVSSFSGILQNYQPPLTFAMDLPQSLCDYRQSNFLKLIMIVFEYLKNRKSIHTLPVGVQKQTMQQINVLKQRKRYMQHAQKLLPMYIKPILRLRRSSNLLVYLNKNFMSIIISFLNIKEIFHLSLSSKKIKKCVNLILQDQIIEMKKSKAVILNQIGLSEELSQAIVYCKHLQLFMKNNNGFIVQSQLSCVLLRDQIRAVCFALCRYSKEEIEQIYAYRKQSQRRIMLKCTCKLVAKDKLEFIEKQLLNNPTLESIKKKFDKKKGDSFFQIACILLYYSIKGIKMINDQCGNKYSFQNAQQLYTVDLFIIDTFIHCYSRLIGITKEEIPVLQQPYSYEFQQLL